MAEDVNLGLFNGNVAASLIHLLCEAPSGNSQARGPILEPQNAISPSLLAKIHFCGTKNNEINSLLQNRGLIP
jgi:hypothetical protein